MQHVDVQRPEPVLFLLEAADAMKDYHAKHGSYASEWYQLDISFANGPYRVNDSGTRPKRADKAGWRPKNCDYTYWIVSSDANSYLLEARNKDKIAEYQMRPDMEKPGWIGASPEPVPHPPTSGKE